MLQRMAVQNFDKIKDFSTPAGSEFFSRAKEPDSHEYNLVRSVTQSTHLQSKVIEMFSILARATDDPTSVVEAIKVSFDVFTDRLCRGISSVFDKLDNVLKNWEIDQGFTAAAKKIPLLHLGDSRKSSIFRFLLVLARYGQAVDQIFQFLLCLRRDRSLNRGFIPIAIFSVVSASAAKIGRNQLGFANFVKSFAVGSQTHIAEAFGKLRATWMKSMKTRYVHPEAQLVYYLLETGTAKGTAKAIGFPDLPCFCCGVLSSKSKSTSLFTSSIFQISGCITDSGLEKII